MKTQEFLDVVCDALNRPHGSLTLDDTPESVDEWDSMGHLVIIMTVDSELAIPVNDPELRNFTSIRELIDKLRARDAIED